MIKVIVARANPTLPEQIFRLTRMNERVVGIEIHPGTLIKLLANQSCGSVVWNTSQVGSYEEPMRAEKSA